MTTTTTEKMIVEKEVLGEEVEEQTQASPSEGEAPPASSDAIEPASKVEEKRCVSGQNEGGVKNNAARANGKRKRRRQRHRRGGRERHAHANHNHKWKPYDKLTWAERHALEERETARALRVREERFASGHPVAPYNTTQFLMEDHINWSGQPKLSPALIVNRKHRAPRERHCSAPGGNQGQSPGCSDPLCEDPGCKTGEEGGNSEVGNSSEYDFDDDEDMDSAFLAKEEEEFSQTYDTIHAESLHNMSKNQLVLEYMELETKLEEMTKKLHRDDGTWPPGQRFYPAAANVGPTFEYNPPHSPSKCCSQINNDEMTRLREKVEALEKENKKMREEMRQLAGARETSTDVNDGGGGSSED